MNLTDRQLHTLRHMLGINTPNDHEPRPYRNHAAVNPGDQEFAELERLGVVELVRKAGRSGVNGEYDLFRCTLEGITAAVLSHQRIRKTRAKRMYTRYLSLSDVIDVTFKEFLTSLHYAAIRAEV